MSKFFRQYNRSDDVVMIPDLPLPEPTLAGDEEELLPPKARAMAAQILEEARQEARQIKQEAYALAKSEKDALLTEAEQQAEQIKEEARREGIRQGRREKQQEIKENLQELSNVLDRLQEEHRLFLNESGQDLKLLAVDIAQKLVEAKIEEDDGILVGLVKKAVQSIREADWISVEISANLPQLAERLEKELGSEMAGTHLEVVPRDLPDGGCWVQTPDGALDASVATQVANLKEIFSHMDEAR